MNLNPLRAAYISVLLAVADLLPESTALRLERYVDRLRLRWWGS